MIGDELLKSVAVSLGRCIGGADFVARLGGDEFAIVQTAIKTRLMPPTLRREFSTRSGRPTTVTVIRSPPTPASALRWRRSTGPTSIKS